MYIYIYIKKKKKVSSIRKCGSSYIVSATLSTAKTYKSDSEACWFYIHGFSLLLSFFSLKEKKKIEELTTLTLLKSHCNMCRSFRIAVHQD